MKSSNNKNEIANGTTANNLDTHKANIMQNVQHKIMVLCKLGYGEKKPFTVPHLFSKQKRASRSLFNSITETKVGNLGQLN